MSDFGDTSGVSSSKGYEYQTLIGAYYLIVEAAREIEYEADGEDLTIINENPNRSSIDFIQVKYKSSGSFTLSNFINDVFPQLWTAFNTALDSHPDKAIRSILVTSVAWNDDLKLFMGLCEKIKTRGLTLDDLDRSPIKRRIDSMKAGKDIARFRRFLWGLSMEHTFPPEHVKEIVLNHMDKCNVQEPRTKLALVKDHIVEKGQGVITRNEIIDIIGNHLIPIKEASNETHYSNQGISEILLGLETSKAFYGPEDEYPDEDVIYRDMTNYIDKAERVLSYKLGELDGSTDHSSEQIHTSLNITRSDAEKAREEALKVAALERDLWAGKKRYAQKANSLLQTAKTFGIRLE